MNLLFQTVLIIALITLGSAGAILSPQSCKVAYQGEDWEQQFDIVGGSGKYSLSYAGLPSWANVSGNKIHGRPSSHGKWPITINYRDEGTGQSRKKNTYINVKPQWSGNDKELWALNTNNVFFNKRNRTINIVPSTTSTTCKLNTYFTISFSVEGGSGSFQWQFGTLPEGLSCSGNTIFGKPTRVGVFNIRVSVSNAYGESTFAIITITVQGGLQLDREEINEAKRLELVNRDLQIAQKEVAANQAVKDAIALVEQDEKAAHIAEQAFQLAESALQRAKRDAQDAAAALKKAQSYANNAANSLTTAQNALNAAQTALTNAQTADNNAQAAVTAAQNAVSQAQSNFNAAQTAFNTAQTNLNNAQSAFTAAQTALNNAQSAFNTAQQNLSAAQTALTQAQNALTQAIQNQKTTASQLAQAQTNVASAQTALNNAKTANDQAQAALNQAIANNNAAQAALAKAQQAEDAACKANDLAQDALKAAKAQLYKAQCNKAQIDQQAAILLAQYVKYSPKTQKIYDGPVNVPTNCNAYQFPFSFGTERINNINNGCYQLSSGRIVHVESCTIKNKEPRVGDYISWNGYYQGTDIWATNISCN